MVKKNNYNGLLIGIAIVIAAIIIAPKLNFNFSTINQETINQLNNEKDGTCSISLDKSIINEGDSITGNLKDGANTLCSIYGNMDNTGWKKIGEGTTNALGVLSITDNLYVPGTFEFRAICGTCVTNTANLIVNPVASSTCTDTDGINKMTPGWVTSGGISYYDDCVNNVVTEYYCNGDIVATRILPCDSGYACYETRSGDYCRLTDTLNPGDIIGMESGNYPNMPAGSSQEYIINLETSPGSNPICAEIEVEALLAVPACIPGMPIVRFDFLDSTGVVWTKAQAVDFSTYGNPAIVHVSWDGQTPFRMITKNQGFCNVNARSTVKLVVCE